MNLYVTDREFSILSNNIINADQDIHITSIMALAKTISDSLELTKDNTFGKKHAVKVTKLIYEINEYIIVPIDDLLTLTKSFYNIRYSNAFPPAYIADQRNTGSILNVFSISTYLDVSKINLINSNYSLFLKMLTLSSTFLTEMNGSKLEVASSAEG